MCKANYRLEVGRFLEASGRLLGSKTIGVADVAWVYMWLYMCIARLRISEINWMIFFVLAT